MRIIISMNNYVLMIAQQSSGIIQTMVILNVAPVQILVKNVKQQKIIARHVFLDNMFLEESVVFVVLAV